MRFQQLDDGLVPAPGGELQQCPTSLVLRVDINLPYRNQQLDSGP